MQVESLVPVLVELKRALEAAHSPLLGELQATLRTQLRDHKAEVRALREGRLDCSVKEASTIRPVMKRRVLNQLHRSNRLRTKLRPRRTW